MSKSGKAAQDLARSELEEFNCWVQSEIKDLVFLRDVQTYLHMLIDKFYRERKK